MVFLLLKLGEKVYQTFHLATVARRPRKEDPRARPAKRGENIHMVMKKFLNDPANLTKELLEGYTA